MLYAYRDRRNKKRTFRALWIMRINAGARQYGMSYSQFMGKLKEKNIGLNRKVLADLAMNDPKAFEEIVKKSNNSLNNYFQKAYLYSKLFLFIILCFFVFSSWLQEIIYYLK